MRIAHNIPALTAYNALSVTNKALSRSIQRLSTGLRINSAADDAAGLAISERMRAQTAGLSRAIDNSENGISLLQTAEGALDSMQSILQRMRELSVQAANDTLTSQDRSYIQDEIEQLKGSINNIANTTKFNGKRLLDGSSAALWSSDKLSTKAYIRGALIDTDQFNQKTNFEGNYKITINATPGQAQIQKSNILTVKHKGLSKATEIKEYVVPGVSTFIQAQVNNAETINKATPKNATFHYYAEVKPGTEKRREALCLGYEDIETYVNTITFNDVTTENVKKFREGETPFSIRLDDTPFTINPEDVTDNSLEALRSAIATKIGNKGSVSIKNGNSIVVQSVKTDSSDTSLHCGNADTISDEIVLKNGTTKHNAEIIFPKDTAGALPEDEIKQFSHTDSGEMHVRIGSDEFTLNSTDMVGTSVSALVTALKNTKNGDGSKTLSDVASVSYSLVASKMYEITITPKNTKLPKSALECYWISYETDDDPEYTNTLTFVATTTEMTRFLASPESEIVITNGDLNAGGSSYTIRGRDITDSNGNGVLDANDLVTAIDNKLGYAGSVRLDTTSTGYKITITTSKTDGIESSLTGKWTAATNTGVYPNELKFSGITNANLDDFVDNDGRLSVTVGGNHYTVNGTDLKDNSIVTLINALREATDVDGNKLSDIADVNSSPSGEQGPYTITIKTRNNRTSDSSLSGNWYSKADPTIQKDIDYDNVHGTVVFGEKKTLTAEMDASDVTPVTKAITEIKATASSIGTPSADPADKKTTDAKYVPEVTTYTNWITLGSISNYSADFSVQINGVTIDIHPNSANIDGLETAIKTAIDNAKASEPKISSIEKIEVTHTSNSITIKTTNKGSSVSLGAAANNISPLVTLHDNSPKTDYATLTFPDPDAPTPVILTKDDVTNFLANNQGEIKLDITTKNTTTSAETPHSITLNGANIHADVGSGIKAIEDALKGLLNKELGTNRALVSHEGEGTTADPYKLIVKMNNQSVTNMSGSWTSVANTKYQNTIKLASLTPTEVQNFVNGDKSVLTIQINDQTITIDPDDIKAVDTDGTLDINDVLDTINAELNAKTAFDNTALYTTKPVAQISGTNTIEITFETSSAPTNLSGSWTSAETEINYDSELTLKPIFQDDIEDFAKNDVGLLSVTLNGEEYSIMRYDIPGSITMKALANALQGRLNSSAEGAKYNFSVTTTGFGTDNSPYELTIRANNKKEPIEELNITWESEPDPDILPWIDLEIGDIAGLDTRLYDIREFWDANGNYKLVDPQVITITQGDGQTTDVTIYGNDTVHELRAKLNSAIAYGLGQWKYVTKGNVDYNFVTFVDEFHTNNIGPETVGGTLVVRSAVAGTAGKLHFSSTGAIGEDLLEALGLNTIQQAAENIFTASVHDAHSGEVIANNVNVSGNKLIGAIHENVDVEFDLTADINAIWNDNMRSFDLVTDKATYTTILHLAENSLVLQTGANEGENLLLSIGSMSVSSLGLGSVIVTDRESAARSITILDNAITRVSTQRSKIGAFQNRLEYNISNLTTTYTNLSDAESRIRDADMAQEMMEFVKLQILNQAGTSMLAQANQLPQSILSLLG